MKTKVLVAIFAISLVLLLALAAAPARDRWYRYLNNYAVDYYKSNLAVFHQRVAQNLPFNSVVFYGDSLVQGLAVDSVVPNAVNFGIGHATVRDVLNNIQKQAGPVVVDAIVLAVGINDVLAGHSNRVLPGYKSIIGVIPMGTSVLISLIAPVDQDMRPNTRVNATITDINASLLFLCDAHVNVSCLSWAGDVSTSDGQLDRAFHTGDGLHFNRLGNAIWLGRLEQALEPMLIDEVGTP